MRIETLARKKLFSYDVYLRPFSTLSICGYIKVHVNTRRGNQYAYNTVLCDRIL